MKKIKPPNIKSLSQQHYIIWGLLFLSLTVIGLMSAAQNYMLDVVEKKMDFSWFQVLSFNVPLWWLWLAITPVIIALGKKYRIQRGQLVQSLTIHIAVSLLIIVVLQVISAAWCNLHFPPYYMPVMQKVFWRLVHLEWAFVDFVAYWMLLTIFYGYEYYQHLQARELKVAQLETQLVESELRALKMQLHPHFLFNTMNALSTMILKGENKTARKMIEQFSSFLRMTLEEKGSQEVPFECELNFVQRYLEVEKVRYQHKLNIQYDVAPQSLNAQVPNLILQPIVENAIRHAIAPMESDGCLTIRALRKNGSLILQVQDNGKGMTPETLTTSGKGIGLSNTRKRLENLYGENYYFDLSNAIGGGLVVTLEIPFQEYQHTDDDQTIYNVDLIEEDA